MIKNTVLRLLQNFCNSSMLFILAKEADNKTSEPKKQTTEDEKITPIDIPVVESSGEKETSM